jgi:LmbE family N-acetylglucosaminyl deacetylase
MNLFVFAHQDDEFGVFHEIKKRAASGEEIAVVYLTSGTFDGSASPVRNAESLKVLSQLGVPRENVFFLGGESAIPDGRLSRHIEKAYHQSLDAIAKIGKPSRIYVLAWEGGHQDHDAAHLIALALARKFGIEENCFQFPLYTGSGTAWIIFRLFANLKSNGETIRVKIPLRDRIAFLRYITTYRSQVKTWVFLIPFLLFHYLFFGTQGLQGVSISRIARQPHEGKMLYERRGFYTHREFADDVEIFVASHL